MRNIRRKNERCICRGSARLQPAAGVGFRQVQCLDLPPPAVAIDSVWPHQRADNGRRHGPGSRSLSRIRHEVGLTSTLTLDATIVDFAQVEADERQINLTRNIVLSGEAPVLSRERPDVSAGPCRSSTCSSDESASARRRAHSDHRACARGKVNGYNIDPEHADRLAVNKQTNAVIAPSTIFPSSVCGARSAINSGAIVVNGIGEMPRAAITAHLCGPRVAGHAQRKAVHLHFAYRLPCRQRRDGLCRPRVLQLRESAPERNDRLLAGGRPLQS